jgi:medium-chain acyl-[acyl-carrier-protein] hydrolase
VDQLFMMSDSSWFVCPQPNPAATTRLFCFPYAGGGIPVFRGWGAALTGVEVWVASLPGRGTRLRERPLRDLALLVEQLGLAITPAGAPVAFFGHSLGGRLAFEVACWLRRQGRPLPLHLFVSACPAPQCPPSQPSLHTLPRDELIAALRARGALPEAVIAHQELLDLVLPALEADFALLETAVYTAEPPLSCPITVFGGAADPEVDGAALAAWATQTTAAFRTITLPGDHLFLHTTQAVLWREINAVLSQTR